MYRLIKLACLMCCVMAAQLDTNTYLNNHRGTVGVTRHRNTCYFVGAMLCSIFNFLLILVLGASFYQAFHTWKCLEWYTHICRHKHACIFQHVMYV